MIPLDKLLMAALAMFRPSALKSRKETPTGEWRIPEAAFQFEMYACLKKVLPGHYIFSEYAKNKTGRIDFYLPDHDKGIELLQNGSDKQIKEHTSRFHLLCGKYAKWDILKDFMIVNFCFGSSHHDLRKTGEGVYPLLASSRLITLQNLSMIRSCFQKPTKWSSMIKRIS